MSKPAAKITIPQVLDRFVAYYRENPTWGSLHIVLDDDNVDDDDVEFCIGWAVKERDKEGETLGLILLEMSRSQRLRLHGKVREVIGR